MFIKSTMYPNTITKVWEETKAVFEKYNIPLEKQSLDTLVDKELLATLVQELNTAIGSTATSLDECG